MGIVGRERGVKKEEMFASTSRRNDGLILASLGLSSLAMLFLTFPPTVSLSLFARCASNLAPCLCLLGFLLFCVMQTYGSSKTVVMDAFGGMHKKY